MCIILSVKLFWCSSIAYIYGKLVGGTSALGRCAFCYMSNVFSVVVFHTLWSIGVGGILLYVKLIWCTGIPYIYGQLEGGYICPKYMCILLYVKRIWCSGIPYIYDQLEGVTSTWSICAFCCMLNVWGVVVLHRSMVNWRQGALVYLHSSLCKTYLV